MNANMHDPETRATISEIFGHLGVVAKNTSLYPVSHPIVMEPAAEAVRLLKIICGDLPKISFHIVRFELYFEKQLLAEETITHGSFIKFLADRGINNFSLARDVSPRDIARFFAVQTKERPPAQSQQELKQRLKDEGITGIEFDSLVAIDLVGNMYNLVDKEPGSAATHSYHGAVDYLESVENDITANAPVIDKKGLQNIISSLIEDFLTDRSAILGVMSIKSYDKFLFHHSVNVAITSLLIAKKLLLTEERMRLVGLSGLLHDLGKLKVPREIINKDGRLTEAEWSIMRRHPIEGAQMLMRYENLGELPVLAALEHHAGYDLSGYPSLRGKTRPHILARIVGIADVYEAMTANRSYRPAQALDTAIKALLNGSGAQFDPLLVKLLLGITGVFPPGTMVRLHNGATAVVVEPNEDLPFFPKIKLLDQSFSAPDDAPLVNTADDPAAYAIAGVAESEGI